MITPYIPRLSQSGGQRHSFYTIKYLSRLNDITLICISQDDAGLDDIKKFCRKVTVVRRGNTWDIRKIIATGFSLFPFLLMKYKSRELKKTILSELSSHHFDLIHCDCLYPMPSIPATNIPLILVDVTIEYAIYEHFVENLHGWKKIISPLLWLDVLKLKYWETRYWRTTHTVVMFSAEDQKFVADITRRRDIKVFLDGVDPKYFSLPSKTKKTKNPTILFGVSNMKWMQNRESADIVLHQYWPKIKKKYPSAQLYVVGRHAPDFYGKYQSPDIIVTEADAEGGPHDPQYFYERSWMLLAPMASGGGTRNKFLEGMTFGLPVITTPEGGMGSIQIKNYHHAIVAPGNQILKWVFRLLDDNKYRKQIGKNAKDLIKNNYAFDKCVDDLNLVYDQITGKK